MSSINKNTSCDVAVASREANQIIYSIKTNTSVEEFEELRKGVLSYSLNHGTKPSCETALAFAAKSGNLQLVDYLIKTGGKNLRDLRCDQGMTPIFHAMTSTKPDKIYAIVKTLIENGANVNLVVRDIKNFRRIGRAIDYAFDNKLDRNIIKILALNGAKTYYLGDGNEKQLLEIQKELRMDLIATYICGCIHNGSPLGYLPVDISHIILEYATDSTIPKEKFRSCLIALKK